MQKLVAVMRSIKPDGSGFTIDNFEDVHEAVVVGLIENREQQKRCRTCGASQLDFRFWRITEAGRLLLAAVETASQGEAA